MLNKVFQIFATLLLVFFVSGCSSYSKKADEINGLIHVGKYDEAVGLFKEGAEKEGVDQLLYILDRGMVYHLAGNYKLSNHDFSRANDIADIKDYTSISKEAMTLVSNEKIIDYKGEDFEKVLINVYMALNYAFLGDYENSLVACRRVNRQLYMLKSQGGRNYRENAFARYLSAILYEKSGDYNSAYIDLKKTKELIDDPTSNLKALSWGDSKFSRTLGLDLWRVSKKQDFTEDVEKWEKEFSITEDEKRLEIKKVEMGQIVFVLENGRGPEKRPDPSWEAVPRFYKMPSSYYGTKLILNGNSFGATQVLQNIEGDAIHNLEEKWGALIAKKVAGVLAKEVVSRKIDENSRFLGFLSRVVMYSMDQADLRSWKTLPRDLQLLRVWVDPDTYKAEASPVYGGGSGSYGSAALLKGDLEVKKGDLVFIKHRQF